MTEIKRQLPNFLTIIRIPMAILCGYFAVSMQPIPLSISLGLFLLASATDFLDGYLARKWGSVSKFGKIFDPIADKILIIGVFLVFTYHGIIPIILTALIVLREVLLTVIRLILLSRRVVLAARFSGKLKTFTQTIVLIIIYLLLIFFNPIDNSFYEPFIQNTIFLLILGTLSITLYSAYEFIHFNRKSIEKIW